MNPLRRLSRVQAASLGGSLVGGLFYFAVLLDLRWAPARTAHPAGYASNFFDFQAKSLMEGTLAVPREALGIEAFVMGDQTFMYFPPFPALLRIPVVLITDEFFGRLTVLSMAVAWLVFAIMATRLVWLVAQVVGRPAEPSRLEAIGASILIAMMTGGTVLTFDAALPWVYHEVYAWAIAAVVGSLYWLLRSILDASYRNLWWLTAFAMAAALTRTTGGIAVCGAIVLAALWSWYDTRGQTVAATGRITSAHNLLGLAAALPMVVSTSINMLKFNHVYMFPLENQVWTTLSERRREALAANGGTITGPQFLEPNFRTYFGYDGIRFMDYFPWVSLPAHPPPLDEAAFFDQTYRTASVTATTPLLLVLLITGAALLLRRRDVWPQLVPPFLGGLVVGLPVLMYGYNAYRYTSDFVPALVIGGIVGYWLLVARLGRRPRWVPRTLLIIMSALTAYSLVVQSVLGLTISAVTQGGQQLQRYVDLQSRFSGGPGSPQDRLTILTPELPADAPTDTLAIKGDCRGVFLETGDRYEPWVLVDAEPIVMQGSLGRDINPGIVKIATVEATRSRDVLLEVRRDHHVRVLVRDREATFSGNWFGVFPDTTFRVGIAHEPGLDLAVVSSTPGGFVSYIPTLIRDEDWFTTPGRIQPDTTGNRWVGLTIREITPTPSSLCRDLVASHTNTTSVGP